MVERFLKQGVRELDSPEQAEPGETVIIRAHGVPAVSYTHLDVYKRQVM